MHIHICQRLFTPLSLPFCEDNWFNYSERPTMRSSTYNHLHCATQGRFLLPPPSYPPHLPLPSSPLLSPTPSLHLPLTPSPSPPRDINGMVVCSLLGLLSDAILTSFLGLLRVEEQMISRCAGGPYRPEACHCLGLHTITSGGEGGGAGACRQYSVVFDEPYGQRHCPPLPPPPLRFLPLFTSPSLSSFLPLFRYSMFSYRSMP